MVRIRKVEPSGRPVIWTSLKLGPDLTGHPSCSTLPILTMTPWKILFVIFIFFFLLDKGHDRHCILFWSIKTMRPKICKKSVKLCFIVLPLPYWWLQWIICLIVSLNIFSIKKCKWIFLLPSIIDLPFGSIEE